MIGGIFLHDKKIAWTTILFNPQQNLINRSYRVKIDFTYLKNKQYTNQYKFLSSFQTKSVEI